MPSKTGLGFKLGPGQHTKRKQKLSALRDAETGSDFVFENREFLKRKKRCLMGENRFRELVTVGVVLIECRVGNYDTSKGNFAT